MRIDGCMNDFVLSRIPLLFALFLGRGVGEAKTD
jgi:hypothetical protein